MSQRRVPEEMIPWPVACRQPVTEKIRSRSNCSPCGLKPMAECRAPQYPATDTELVERGLRPPICKCAHPADRLRLMHDGAIDIAETHALLHGAQPGPGQQPTSKTHMCAHNKPPNHPTPNISHILGGTVLQEPWLQGMEILLGTVQPTTLKKVIKQTVRNQPLSLKHPIPDYR